MHHDEVFCASLIVVEKKRSSKIWFPFASSREEKTASSITRHSISLNEFLSRMFSFWYVHRYDECTGNRRNTKMLLLLLDKHMMRWRIILLHNHHVSTSLIIYYIYILFSESLDSHLHEIRIKKKGRRIDNSFIISADVCTYRSAKYFLVIELAILSSQYPWDESICWMYRKTDDEEKKKTQTLR